MIFNPFRRFSWGFSIIIGDFRWLNDNYRWFSMIFVDLMTMTEKRGCFPGSEGHLSGVLTTRRQCRPGFFLIDSLGFFGILWDFSVGFFEGGGMGGSIERRLIQLLWGLRDPHWPILWDFFRDSRGFFEILSAFLRIFSRFFTHFCDFERFLAILLWFGGILGDPDGIFQDSWRSCTGSMGFQGIFGNSVGIGWELEGSIRIFRDLLGFLAILL